MGDELQGLLFRVAGGEGAARALQIVIEQRKGLGGEIELYADRAFDKTNARRREIGDEPRRRGRKPTLFRGRNDRRLLRVSVARPDFLFSFFFFFFFAHDRFAFMVLVRTFESTR